MEYLSQALSLTEPEGYIRLFVFEDQTALHGVLIKIRDLGIPLLSLTRIEMGRESEANSLLYWEEEGCGG